MSKPRNPVDEYVGSRVRTRRMLVGMSQERLGDALGVTFQQIQKYEKGSNRIGASRLHQIGQVLNVPVSFFYDGVAPEGSVESAGFAEARSTDYAPELTSMTEGLDLMRAFVKIQDAGVRRKLVELVEALAENPRS